MTPPEPSSEEAAAARNAEYVALRQALPDIHGKMADEVPGAVKDSIFKQLHLDWKPDAGDNMVVVGHVIMYCLYGFRPGGRTVAESFALRHKDKTTGVLRQYLEAVERIRFSIHGIVAPPTGKDDMCVRLRDELDPSWGEQDVLFPDVAELSQQENVCGLLVAGYVMPLLGGHIHITPMLTASEELLVEAVARKKALGRKAESTSGKAELTRFITRRALREEIGIRADMETLDA